MIDSGQLDRRVTLQQAATAQDSLGQPIETWSDVATLWAKVEQSSSDEELRGRDNVAKERITVTIRYLSGINTAWRLQYNGRAYNIIGAPKELGRRQYQVITAEHVGEQTSV